MQTTFSAKNILRNHLSLFLEHHDAGPFPHPDRGASFFWGSGRNFWDLRPVLGSSRRGQSIERAYDEALLSGALLATDVGRQVLLGSRGRGTRIGATIGDLLQQILPHRA